MSASTQSSPVKGGAKNVTKDHSGLGIELDISKLHSLASEQQDLYLFNYVTTLENHVKGLSLTALIVQQVVVKKELFKVIQLQTPAPTRVIRASLGRCFYEILSKGDRRILFETVKELGDLLSFGKGDKDVRNKHAAAYCLGEVYRGAGDGAINFSSVVCSALIKLYRSATPHVALRAVVFKTLGKIVASVQSSLEEIVAKDIWKHARAAASSDRGSVTQANACWCLEQVVLHTDFFNTTTDFESLKSTIWKTADSSIASVRHASASCLAAIMVKAYSEPTTMKPLTKTLRSKKSKRTAAGQGLAGEEEEEADPVRSGSPGPRKNSLQLELTLSDILRQLSTQYVRASTSNKLRVMIISCYTKVFRALDPSIVESNYLLVAKHLLVDILNNPVIAHSRYRLLLTRRFLQKLLAEVIGNEIMGESGQLSAAKVLINDIVRNYPKVLKERTEPSKNTLTGAIGVLASFIQSLGSAFSPAADNCREALVQVLQHPSYTVQIHASYCLRTFALSCPQQLLQCASICMTNLNKELGVLETDKQAARRSVGYANGLAAVLSISSLQPLYSSLEMNAKVFQQATSLLKSSSQSELRVSGAQVQVAFVLIGGLMALGPNFVKIHISQLLLLWRNALPKPLTRENTKQKQTAELSYLTFVRECALGSILSFLESNTRLLTNDVSKRIAALLQNTIEFLDDLPPVKSESDLISRITPSLQLSDLVQMVRRRVLQCFTGLAIRSPHTSKEILSPANLLTFAVQCFAEPEYDKGSLVASIANSAANFETIWDVADNSGFGVSGLMRGFLIKGLPGEQAENQTNQWWNRMKSIDSTDFMLLSPVCGAREHDSVFMHQSDGKGLEELPDPPATEVVNSAIALFSMALPLQEPSIQESILEQMSMYLTSKALLRDPGRKAAITVNTVLALLGALKVSQRETSANPGNLKSPAVEKNIDELLRALLVDADPCIRHAAHEAMGRLCSGSGNNFTTNVVNGLVDTIITNRDPAARAGCALALGSIHASVGGMAASFHLRKVHGVLMSLCSDPHPTVHFWAVEALSRVVESAGLNFSGYVPSTLGLLAQLWISDSHCEEADAVGTSNAELEMPTPAAIAHTLSSLINVLGPDLQDMSKARDLILTLVRQFDLDDLVLVQGQALQCWEHINLYASGFVDLPRYVQQLRHGLERPESAVYDAAVNGLHNLIRKDASNALKYGANSIEDQIWIALDRPGDQAGIRSLIRTWLQQTSLDNTARWITRFQEVLTKSTTKPSDSKGTSDAVNEQPEAPAIQDDEVAGFNVNDNKGEEGGLVSTSQELLRWQIRAFAVQCLSSLIEDVAQDSQRRLNSEAEHALQSKVAEVIRLAFLASTSSVFELRVAGLKLIDQILLLFGKTPDPDFGEALLLEQYQAQISSALTPAFGADSSPELATTAISVCATFIATGLVKDVDRMGRILKLLVLTLSSFTAEEGEPSVGDLKGLGSNAQRMIKVAVLSAWARLQVASTSQAYLIEVVKPYAASLTPLWLSSLQDFARLRFEPDISSSMVANVDDGLDMVYAALNRETLLKFYEEAWLTLVDAIASLIDQDSEFVFDALDKKSPQSNGFEGKGQDIDYRKEPVAFFFILFGIAFEALMTRSESSVQSTKDQTLEILVALKKIMRPSIAGRAIYQEQVFSETMDLFDRLILTEGFAIQGAIVRITRNLCLSHPSVEADEGGVERLSDDIEQLFELTRIIMLVLATLLPNLTGRPSTTRQELSGEAISLITLALNALVDASSVFPSVIQADLHACIIHIFTTILGTGACQTSVIPKALPIFKRFVHSITEDLEDDASLADQLRNCIRRFRHILANAQLRESEASLPCARNTLMASAILLTSGSEGLPSTDPLITDLLDDVLDCLVDVGLGKTAANCMRSLLLAEAKSDTSQVITAYLLPRLLHFLVDETRQDPENARAVILQALISYLSTLDDGNEAPALLSILLPVVLHRASSEGRESYSHTASRLLAMAGAKQSAFKGVVVKMTADQRSLLEEIVKVGGLDMRNSARDGDERGEPTIALKLNFGGT